MVQGLQAGDVGELFLEKVVDLVQAVLPLGGEDVEVADDGEDAPLEVDY